MSILAVSDAAVNGLYFALTGLLIAGTQVLTSWWSGKRLAAIAATGEKTHTLVNSQMGGVLKLVDELSRWKASREPTPENIKAAELAARMLKEHEVKQAVVDARS